MAEPADLADAAAATAREGLARSSSYAAAQAVVDHLADARFPVEHVQIVGTDLRLVEQVYGRLDWGRAMVLGAASGAWAGLLVGLLLALFAEPAAAAALLLLWGLALGAVFGAAAGAGWYALHAGRRDFVSRSQVVASTYDVMVETAYAAQARELLAEDPGDAAGPG